MFSYPTCLSDRTSSYDFPLLSFSWIFIFSAERSRAVIALLDSVESVGTGSATDAPVGK
ncbi:MAG: hypothetical protein JWM04_29 [Verrucomicrobiales bacterium]|nr:hypothetical protein [Mucilaginibacter sp.]MDB6128922.1 hypothetical protein [Verrucomicrobiales bacterium]